MSEHIDEKNSQGRRGWALAAGFVVALIIATAGLAAAISVGYFLIETKDLGKPALVLVQLVYSAFLLGLGMLVFRKRDAPAFTGMLIGFALAFLLNATCAVVINWK